MRLSNYPNPLILLVIVTLLLSCNKEPDLSFTINKELVRIGEPIALTNTSETKHAYNINWNFGDGGSSQSLNGSHSYASAGEYAITLSATNKKGNKYYSTSSNVTVTETELFGKYQIKSGNETRSNSCSTETTEYEISEGTKNSTINIYENGKAIIEDAGGNTVSTTFTSFSESNVEINLAFSTINNSGLIYFSGVYELEVTGSEAVLVKKGYSQYNNCVFRSTSSLTLQKI